MAGVREDCGLSRFMNRGGFKRFLPFLIVYFAIYLAAGWVSSNVGGHYVDDDLLSSVGSVFFQITLPLIIGAIALMSAATYLGWTKEMFGPQPIYRSWWMWIAPVLLLIPVLLRLLGIEWNEYKGDVVLFVLATGLLIGFVEELVFRGFGVKMLRDGGHGEWAVAAISSALFALSHSLNLLSGQEIATVGATVVYTFAFGVLMYLTLRSLRFLVVAMVLHGLTDPTGILATGDVDKMTHRVESNGLLDAAGIFTSAVILGGLIMLIFIRGRVARDEYVDARVTA